MATIMSFKLVLMLSLLLIISMVDGSLSGSLGPSKKELSITCIAIHGMEAGDTCFSVAQQSELSAEDFSAINPNLDCDNLFVGQWLCVAGSA